MCLCREGHLRKDLLGFDRHWNRYWLLGGSFTTGERWALASVSCGALLLCLCCCWLAGTAL